MKKSDSNFPAMLTKLEIVCSQRSLRQNLMNPTNTKFQQQCKEKTTNSINCSDVMSTFRQISFIFLLAISFTEAFTSVTSQPRAVSKLASVDRESLSSSEADVSRRNVFQKSFVAAIALTPTLANALDMDAFANAQIEADVKNCDPKRDPKCIPKLNADEALCKYGQGGNAKAAACKRVKAAGGDISQAPQGKSLGGAYAM